jgi:DNA topoisomerase-1
VDSRGNRITDPEKIARVEGLRIPPAWREVWISPAPGAKLQATGVDAAGRRQYLYHERFRAAQEQAKFEKLVQFGERLPDLRETMAEHMELEELEPERVCAVAIRLVNLGWFRVGSDRYAKTARTFGITTLRKRHVDVRGHTVTFRFRGKGRAQVHRAIADEELAGEVRRLLRLPGGTRLFRYGLNGDLCNLTGDRLNDYIAEHLGDDFTAKDFRTWGGTLLAAVELAEHGPGRERRGGEARRRRGDAERREGARKHTGGMPRVVRQPSGRRAVLRGAHARGFPAPGFARGRRAGYRAGGRGTGAALVAALVANSAVEGCGIVTGQI